jgi:hypothetical protein
MIIEGDFQFEDDPYNVCSQSIARDDVKDDEEMKECLSLSFDTIVPSNFTFRILRGIFYGQP